MYTLLAMVAATIACLVEQPTKQATIAATIAAKIAPTSRGDDRPLYTPYYSTKSCTHHDNTENLITPTWTVTSLGLNVAPTSTHR